MAAAIPRDPVFDSTLSLLWQGYPFVAQKCRQLNSDIFKTRLLLQPVICMQGSAAARLFYDAQKFMRHAAMPMRVQRTLTGVGGVQGLDGAAHQQRKHLFLRYLMQQENIDTLAALHRKHWHLALSHWPLDKEMVLFDQAQLLLCQSVCEWAGIPVAEQALTSHAKDLGQMIAAGARLGLPHWQGRWARTRCETWIRREIERVRRGPPQSLTTLLQAFAWHRDEHGQLLSSQIAAVEILNVLRPTVAIAQLIVFCALAMHEYPHVKTALRTGNPDYLHWFIQEVRRFYPFFPFLAAYTRHPFSWNGYAFPDQTLTLLDIYGTHHHHSDWPQADHFLPSRFQTWQEDGFHLLANGGGEYSHHRCPGEWITVTLLQEVVALLVNDLDYAVPTQNLNLSLRNIPTLPSSGFILRPRRYRPSSSLFTKHGSCPHTSSHHDASD